MHHTQSGLCSRSIVLLFALSLGPSISSAFAQARHEYAPPNPQQYQHAPVQQKLPDFEPAPEQQRSSEPSGDQAAPQQAQPLPQQAPTASEESVAETGNELLDFLQQHMAATFLCLLLLAPLWAMFGMRKTKHPYDH